MFKFLSIFLFYLIIAACGGGSGSSNPQISASSDRSAAKPTNANNANPHANLTWNGPGMCVDCHQKEAIENHSSVHYQWSGATPNMTNSTTGGKNAGAMNAYCINIAGNWGGCGKCHTGYGAKPESIATDQQLRNIDCLLCHQENYIRKKDPATGLYIPDTALMKISMDAAVQTLQKTPTRKACLQCHATAGGGDGVKRGDLALAHASTTDKLYDIHMATTGANLSCTQCHTTKQHKIAGRGSDLRPNDSVAAMTCSTTSCHSSKVSGTSGHSDSAINSHMGRVACQSCHIRTYAKNASDTAATEATEVFRDWSQPHLNTTTNQYHPLMQMQNDLTPRYLFWNKKSWGYNLFDPASIDAVTGNYAVSRPQGGINDQASKLYPFKYKTALQPLDTQRNRLIALDTAVYFRTGNMADSIVSGLKNMGYDQADPYKMVTTDEYLALNHEVGAKNNALSCNDCHGATARMNLKTMGYALKGAESSVCVQCHEREQNPGFTKVHKIHVTEKKVDCLLCHSFSRPERKLNTALQRD